MILVTLRLQSNSRTIVWSQICRSVFMLYSQWISLEQLQNFLQTLHTNFFVFKCRSKLLYNLSPEIPTALAISGTFNLQVMNFNRSFRCNGLNRTSRTSVEASYKPFLSRGWFAITVMKVLFGFWSSFPFMRYFFNNTVSYLSSFLIIHLSVLQDYNRELSTDFSNKPRTVKCS